ncbi:MAG: hypothetical protein LBC35_07910 [Coriobacteriales bacterium]|jgi:hypothetical protein|nr:hypothetical protein [Coriobacteriales bacterium]
MDTKQKMQENIIAYPISNGIGNKVMVSWLHVDFTETLAHSIKSSDTAQVNPFLKNEQARHVLRA